MSTTTSGWSSSEDCVPDVPMSPEERDGIIKKQVQTFTKLYRKKLSQVGDCDENEALQQSEALSEENCKLQEKLDLMQKCVNQRDSKINEMNCQLTELTDILCNREAEMANATVNEVDIAERVRELETELECCQKDYHAKDQILKNYARENTAMKRDLQEGSCSRKSTIDVGGSGDAAVLKLQKKLDTQRDLQIALTGEVAEKHDTIIALKEQIHELEGKLRQTEIQAHFKDDIIRELRKEVKLGRAKESLAEMLGLKEGPRVQMKARIDRLNSELEERANEILRLNTLVDSSALVNLENQVKTLTLDLSSRDKKILSLCDKMDYVRSYLNQLKSEEQLSIKCGLEALITELTDDAQNIREVRRNVSISLDREPNESVIIINHRSHSLPDSTLQKQVNTFKTSSKIDNQNFLLGMPSQSTKFALKDLSRLKQLGVSLETSRTNLCDSWNAVKHFNTADFAECCAEIDSTLARIDADRSSLNVVCNHFEVFTNWLADTHNRCSNNIFLFTSVQECLGGILEKLDKNFVHYPDDDEFSRTNTSLFHTLQSSINLVMSQLVKLESNCTSQNDAVTKIDLEKLKENQKCLARIASNKMVDIKQLTSVKNQHDSIAKSLEEKLSELDANFLQHINATNSVESELEMIVERLEKLHGESSLISVYTSTDDLQSADTEEKPGASVMGLETVLKKVDSSKLLELMDNDGQMVELFAPSPFHSKFSNSSFTSDSTSKEGIETPLGIEVRGALMNSIARSLCTEINNLISQVIHRDQKIFNFEKSGFNLCNSLDQTQKEIENILSASMLSKNVDSECLSTLNTTLTTTACQVQNLLTQAKVYMSEREMIEALRLKKEQGICSMMSDLVKTTEEVIADVKMFEQENKAAENDALKRIVAEKDDKMVEIVAQIHALEDKLAKLEDQLKIEIREKILLKAEKERTMEEMQSKISKLQTALQEDKIPPVSNKYSWLPWPLCKPTTRHTHDI